MKFNEVFAEVAVLLSDKINRLWTDAEEILTALAERRIEFPNANWGDIGVSEVLATCDGERLGWQVLIEEASDECLEFAVAEALAKKGWLNVKVKTEW